MKRIARRLGIRIIIRRYEVIIGGLVMLLSGAVIPSSWDPPMRLHRPPPVQVPAPVHHPLIALTFDDGPHPVLTERLLSVLHDAHAPGTFFVVGKMADRYPQLLRKIAGDGHELANHTYNHPNMSRLEDAAVIHELVQTRETIKRLTGRDAVLWRPPGGDYSRNTVRVAAREGYHMILWSILTSDVQGASSKTIYRRIVDGADDGGIVLMHSGVPSTIDVLPRVIATLREQGYEFVTVSTLLASSKTNKKPAVHETPLMQTASASPTLRPRTE